MVDRNATLVARRQLALYHLRVNPHNRKQITDHLVNDQGDRCALGLICEAFNVSCNVFGQLGVIIHPDPYKEIGRLLQIDYGQIYGLNDEGYTFSQIADEMERAIETGEWDKEYV